MIRKQRKRPISVGSGYKLLLAMDVHSPDSVRVDGILSSTDAFYTAYDVQPGDGMYVAPEDRVRIW
jgi:putative endopeptidase